MNKNFAKIPNQCIQISMRNKTSIDVKAAYLKKKTMHLQTQRECHRGKSDNPDITCLFKHILILISFENIFKFLNLSFFFRIKFEVLLINFRYIKIFINLNRLKKLFKNFNDSKINTSKFLEFHYSSSLRQRVHSPPSKFSSSKLIRKRFTSITSIISWEQSCSINRNTQACSSAKYERFD